MPAALKLTGQGFRHQGIALGFHELHGCYAARPAAPVSAALRIGR